MTQRRPPVIVDFGTALEPAELEPPRLPIIIILLFPHIVESFFNGCARFAALVGFRLPQASQLGIRAACSSGPLAESPGALDIVLRQKARDLGVVIVNLECKRRSLRGTGSPSWRPWAKTLVVELNLPPAGSNRVMCNARWRSSGVCRWNWSTCVSLISPST